MRDSFSFLGELIKAGIKRTGLQQAVTEKAALTVWAEVVGEKTASVTSADSVREGILYVTCRDNMWAQELHFLRPMIIEKLNERLGGEVVKEIRLSGRGFRKGSKGKVEKPEPEKQEEEIRLSDAEEEKIQAAVKGIENQELAKRVARGLEASRKLWKKYE